ncbi:MAG: NIPSNAP family protein [Syntrophorhabdales bacterium]|jgi:hypothetical protein
MVKWTRSGRAKVGKMWQAVAFAKEITEYINKKYGVSLSAYTDAFGEIGTIRWFADYANLDAKEKLFNQLMADKEYMQKLSPIAELFVEGSFYDTVMFAL